MSVRKNTMFKGIFALIIVLTMLLISPMAMAVDEATQDSTVTASGETVEPRAEETVWYTAYDDQGRLWMRQWSLTHGIWLTDWILVG